MSWFRQEFEKEIIRISKTAKAPEPWQWMVPQPPLQKLEQRDITIVSKLKQLHKENLDNPELALLILTKAELLKAYMRNLGMPDDKKTQTILAELNHELDALSKQEIEYCKKTQGTLQEDRLKAAPKKIRAFFTAKSYKAEQDNEELNAFLNAVGWNTSSLYDFLRIKYSGHMSNAQIMAECIQGTGDKKALWDKLRGELKKIEHTKDIGGIAYTPGTGWSHFTVNGDTNAHFKAYISFDYNTFHAAAFQSALKELAKAGFNGQIKIPDHQATDMLFQQDDNIVIHGGSLCAVARAAQLAVSVLEKNKVRIGGGSRAAKSNTAQDITLPELPSLGLKPHKTSFTDAVAKLACEFLLAAIKGSRQNIKSYDNFRCVVKKLFSENGEFVGYLKKSNLWQ